jgi:inosine-uridine nucleoside N-ribohydrolase
MDGGIDDALALILALQSPELEVAGITAVSGNVPVEQATINGLRVVELMNRRDVWVAKGLGGPLVREPIRATSFHGRDGLGESNLPLPKLKPSKKNALNTLSDELASSKKHGIGIICTGPLTNIAALVTGSLDLARRIEQLVIMGGAYGLTQYGYGNETPVAEFNIYSDPEAAKIVFESQIPITAVGLDVTTIPRSRLNLNDYKTIRSRDSNVARFAERILKKAIQKHGRFQLHDPMAVAAKVAPSLFHTMPHPVNVETRGEFTAGMTVVDRRDQQRGRRRRNITLVCDAVKADDFKRMFLNRLLET